MIHKCDNCNNGQLGDFGDLKVCDWCGTVYHEGTPPEKKIKVEFT
jgi:hypothetical protein